MGLDFKIKDFAYPFSIIKLKKRFERNQWLSQSQLAQYQLQRLKIIINHAYKNVPYYRKLFKKLSLIPQDIKSLDDLKVIPFLTKDILKNSFNSLLADNFKKFKPTLQHTSGTSGSQVKFYTDKFSNVLEFVYYWRLWSGAGYRLGDKFAELSAQFFTPYQDKLESICHFNYFTRRLMVNSLLICSKNQSKYIRALKRHRPLFLKGLPSNLYMLALVMSVNEDHGISFKAIFSQGENLLSYQRELIEKVFSCKVFDSYGLMERVAAISECSLGRYHINSDYSILELLDVKSNYDSAKINLNAKVSEIVGTSLYNFSMPLIRYKTGDLVLIGDNSRGNKCFCQRGFPEVKSIIGRSSDIVITPDKRAITALYVALDRTPGIIIGQIVQEDINSLLVKIAVSPEAPKDIKEILIKNIRDFVGLDMAINIMYDTVEKIKDNAEGKFKSIISKVPLESFLT